MIFSSAWESLKYIYLYDSSIIYFFISNQKNIPLVFIL